MLKTKFIMIRHGETEWNVQRKFLGHIDIPLNEKGKTQAKFTQIELLNEPIDVIYTSPLRRASETARIIKGERNIPIIGDKELIEINCGEWEGLNGGEIEKIFPGQLYYWINCPWNLKIKNGETIEQVSNRIYRAFLHIAKQERGKTVLITSHMICLQLLMIKINNGSIKDLWKVKSIDNAAVNSVELLDNGEVNIIKWSDNSFIPSKYRNNFVPIAGVDLEND